MDSDPKYKNIYAIGDIDCKVSECILSELLDDDGIPNIDTLNIYISSGGGNLYECLAIMDLIEHQRKRFGYTINTFGLGQVCSGGLFLFTLGDNRILFPMCRIYVHEHIVVSDEGAPFTKKMEEIKEEKKLNEIYVKLIAERLDITTAKAKKLLRKDKWLSDKEIADYNIITGEIDNEYIGRSV